jgi:hypothetical protein
MVSGAYGLIKHDRILHQSSYSFAVAKYPWMGKPMKVIGSINRKKLKEKAAMFTAFSFIL